MTKGTLVGMLLLSCFATEISAATYVPAARDQVLLELGGVVNRNADRTDATVALKSSQDYVAMGRAQNDERYFGYAAALLRPWKNNRHADSELLILLADIAQHQHHFDDAMQTLDRVLAQDQGKVRAHLMRASLYLTQGRPQQARGDCQRVLVLGDLFDGAVCSAQVAGLTGSLKESYRLLNALVERAPVAADENATAGQFSWALGIAADMAVRLGDNVAAQRHLRHAVDLSPKDLPLRLQLCDVLVSMGSADDVRQLLAAAPAIEPVLLRLAVIEMHDRDSRSTDSAIAQWKQATIRSAQLGIRLHLRELARGQLEILRDPQLATATALQNWQVQRETEDARILFQAANASGNESALLLLREWQASLHLEDVGLRP
jgi:tetratricopeptide (TPR) repeat protein